MPGRFKFSHNGTKYEAFGEFGLNEKFIVTQLLPEAKRMLGTQGTPSGARVDAVIADVGTQDELVAELNNKFPGLTSFTSF